MQNHNIHAYRYNINMILWTRFLLQKPLQRIIGSCQVCLCGRDMTLFPRRVSRPEKLRRQSYLPATCASRKTSFFSPPSTPKAIPYPRLTSFSTSPIPQWLMIWVFAIHNGSVIKSLKRTNVVATGSKRQNCLISLRKTLISIRKKYGINSDGEIQPWLPR